MRWVGEATAVMAMGKTFVKMRRHQETGSMKSVHIPEHITVLADMVCGAQATFSISHVTGLAPVQEAILYGSEGTLRFAGGKLSGGQHGYDSLHEIIIPTEEQGSWRVEEEFVRAIRGFEPIQYTTFENGLKYMQFTEAVARSRITRETVSLLQGDSG
jgi:predicted dehydrogenase